MKRRRLTLLAALVAGSWLLTSCATSPAAFRVTGYAESGATSRSQLSASAKAMTEVGIDGVNLTPDGAGVSTADAPSRMLLAETHAVHLGASLLFGNFSNSIGDFSDPLAKKMFDSPENIRAVVKTLAREVESGGWDGVTVDLESLNQFGAPGHKRDDNSGLNSFLTRLRAALGSRPISICLVATPGSYKDLGYDLGAISKQVDHVVLMAYDQHGPTWSKAGPVGGYPWVRASVTSLARGVPKSKIQLGIGEYGYSWPKHGTGMTYSVEGARALVKHHGVKASWSTTQLEYHATFSNGDTIWWSDARSYRARLALARSLHLGGVAVWSLGQSDPL